MVVTDPDAPPHKRASMILVPIDTPGFKGVRPVPVMGHDEGPGHWEVRYEDCRVPADNLLGERGARLRDRAGPARPGRIHHCMRAIGSAERAFELMCRRAHDREAFGGPLAEKQFVQDFIAKSRMEIDSARLMVLHAAWKMDTEGKRAARQDISMIKVIAAQMHQEVLDRAMQVHGALGMSDDTPLAAMWRQGRWLRIADGPGRGAQDGDRAARAQPLQAARAGRGLSAAGAPHATDRAPDEQRASSRRSATSPRARSSTGPSDDGHSDEVAARMGELGWYGLQIPEEYGGSGGSFLDATLFLEEIARGQIPVAAYGVTLIVVGRAQPLRHRGAEARPASAAWRKGGTLAIAMSEPEAGLRRGGAEDARAPRGRRVGARTARRCGAPTPTRRATS